jgi:serine/threonine protein kinase
LNQDRAPEPIPPHPWQGRLLLGRYRFTGQLLGSGGMGDVFLARDENLGINVVIKVPKIAQLGGQKGVERFRKEIQSLLTLSHPHVVKIEGVGIADGSPFAVMQFLEGGSLHDRRRAVHRKPDFFDPMGLAAVGRWLRQVAEALDFIHQSGYVHRDVKPGNILFDKSDNAFLGDFGVAKAIHSAQEETDEHELTALGTVPGTPAYFAPELLELLAAPTGAADQYALATIVFEVITGRRPFVGPTPQDALNARRRSPAPDVRFLYRTLPEPLAAALAQGLAMDPRERFPSCTAFADAVQAGAAWGAADAAVSNADLACSHCNKVLTIDFGFTAGDFQCATCHGLMIAHPELVWVEPVGDDPVMLQKRLERLRRKVSRSGPPPVPETAPQPRESWPESVSSQPPVWTPTPQQGAPDDSGGPVIDTRTADTKTKRRRHEKEREQQKKREELLGVLAAMAMTVIVLVVMLSSCRMR